MDFQRSRGIQCSPARQPTESAFQFIFWKKRGWVGCYPSLMIGTRLARPPCFSGRDGRPSWPGTAGRHVPHQPSRPCSATGRHARMARNLPVINCLIHIRRIPDWPNASLPRQPAFPRLPNWGRIATYVAFDGRARVGRNTGVSMSGHWRFCVAAFLIAGLSTSPASSNPLSAKVAALSDVGKSGSARRSNRWPDL
jgi:hypothetical protein